MGAATLPVCAWQMASVGGSGRFAGGLIPLRGSRRSTNRPVANCGALEAFEKEREPLDRTVNRRVGG